jgi:two-component system, NtrC family, response regulator AtoC
MREIKNIWSDGGVSPENVSKLVAKAAQCDKNVLILGETGTGKDLTAQRIHDLGFRKQEPFIAINCANLPSELVEPELFGYVRGSFTGAYRDKMGILESGGRGTVFLDEIGELPLHLQAKFLRLIDKKEVRRIGETMARTVSARFIFATNRDLKKEVQEGRFRRDLFFRINVIRIMLPPLRERRDEIPYLVHHFLDRENVRNGANKDLSPEALMALMAYDYPGNIRELENLIERACIFCEGSVIGRRDLCLEGEGLVRSLSGPVTPESLRTALVMCRWNKTRAASEIGRSRRQLYRLLEKYQMDDCIRRTWLI